MALFGSDVLAEEEVFQARNLVIAVGMGIVDRLGRKRGTRLL
jgi:hypothetical protein